MHSFVLIIRIFLFKSTSQECHGDVKSPQLLARAKKTIAEGYALVGLTAEMKTNFAVRIRRRKLFYY